MSADEVVAVTPDSQQQFAAWQRLYGDLEHSPSEVALLNVILALSAEFGAYMARANATLEETYEAPLIR